MNHHSDSLLTAMASVTALLFSQISIMIDDQNFMKTITAVSSVVLCLTALIKLIDLCHEKYIKWVKPRLKRKSKSTK